MRPTLALIALSAAALAAPALAQQPAASTSPSFIGPEDTEKVRQVFVYGEDPCPASEGDEIVVCARLPDNDRYRIPKELRTDPNDPRVQSWANRARSIETVGASGTNSCSTSGAGGFTGCFVKLAREAKEERKTMMGSATWADAVQKAREERLSNLDAESEAIERQVQQDEELKPQDDAAAAAARARLEAQEQGDEDK